MVTTRLALQSEVPLLATVERRAHEAFRQYPGLLPPGEATAPSQLLEEAIRDGRLWVAEIQASIAGFALVFPLDGEAHLKQLSVVPESQGQGVGTHLLDTVVAWAAEQSYRWITLSTFRDVRWNAPFYARRGFEAMAEQDIIPGLRSLRNSEAAQGLDLSKRVFMRRSVGQADSHELGRVGGGQ